MYTCLDVIDPNPAAFRLKVFPALRMRRCILCGAIAAMTVLPGFARAQIAVGSDLDVRSRYVWRGVVRSTTPVLQPSLFLSWQPSGWTLTAGGWASIEASGRNDESLTDAGRSRRLAELDYWVEAHTRWRAFDLRLGSVLYDLRGDSLRGGRGSDWDTAEVYGAASLLFGNLTSLGIEAAYDVSAINGAYFTLEALQHIPVVGLHGIMFSALFRAEAGAGLGQQLDPSDPEQPGYFGEDGLTHALLSSSLRVYGSRLGGYAGWTLQVNRDRLTRRVNATETQANQHWFEAGVSALLGSLARER